MVDLVDLVGFFLERVRIFWMCGDVAKWVLDPRYLWQANMASVGMRSSRKVYAICVGVLGVIFPMERISREKGAQL